MKPVSSKVRSPFQRVLFGTNCLGDYEGTLEATFNFCQTNKASLRILHVCREPAGERGETGQAGLILRQMKERAVGLGIRCTNKLALGVPAVKILEAVEEYAADVVVLGTRELRGSKRGAFGPTAEQVMRSAQCAIMTVGPVAAEGAARRSLKGPVVFATDFHSVTRRAIQVAVGYSRGLGLEMHCLHVLPRTMQSSSGERTLPDILSHALQHLVATSGVAIERTVCQVRYGSEISNAVVDYARQEGASLIVLGVRRDSVFSPDEPLPIVFRIITEAPCPVVTVLCDAEADPEAGGHPGVPKSAVPGWFLR